MYLRKTIPNKPVSLAEKLIASACFGIVGRRYKTTF